MRRANTYGFATALVEGADCGVELFDRERHRERLRSGKSSQSAFVVVLYPKKLTPS
jgi:hypothetical protein